MADSPISSLLVTGLLALVGTAVSGIVKSCSDDQLARHKLDSDLVLKALESPVDATRMSTLYMLTQTHLISDAAISRGVVRYKHILDSTKAASPQILPDAAAPTLAAPLAPTTRLYLLTGRLLDKPDDGKKSLDSLRQPLLAAGFTIIKGRYLNDPGRPREAEVRYFFPADQPQAEQLATFFRFHLKRDKLAAKLYTDPGVAPGYLEIWTGK